MYEIWLSIEMGHVVWASGPYKCGLYDDLEIFRATLSKTLNCERITADKIYTYIKYLNPRDAKDVYKEVHRRYGST